MRHHFMVEISDENFEYLNACARIRDVPVTGLFKRLVQHIADEHMVFAILDDESAVCRQHGEHRHRELRK